ncbi:MAG: hypothetical protein JKP98_13930 [Rhodobacteraceae bacterium]|nr:hypothetical protein [Paracoccaceae bacterium]
MHTQDHPAKHPLREKNLALGPEGLLDPLARRALKPFRIIDVDFFYDIFFI